jgi:hypothetical protein
MGKVGFRTVLCLAVLACACAAGCMTTNPAAPAPDVKLDPFVDELLRQEVLAKKPGSATLKPDPVLRELPVKSTVEQARAAMERHGFACWSGVAEANGTCLHCMAYKPKDRGYADRVVVRFFYDHHRVVTAVEVTVEYDVLHSGRWPWSGVGARPPQAPAGK